MSDSEDIPDETLNSYQGDTVPAVCASCGREAMVPQQLVEADERGHCNDCDSLSRWEALDNE